MEERNEIYLGKKHPLIPLLPDHVTMETGSLDFSDT